MTTIIDHGRELDRTQRARTTARFGRVTLKASVQMTPGGLLAVGALVSAVLLSTAVLVHAARKPVRVGPHVQRSPAAVGTAEQGSTQPR